MSTPSPNELAALLAHILADTTDGDEESWREIIGPVHKLPVIDNVQCNWVVIPGGTAKQRSAVAKAVEVVRAEHPYVGGHDTGGAHHHP